MDPRLGCRPGIQKGKESRKLAVRASLTNMTNYFPSLRCESGFLRCAFSMKVNPSWILLSSAMLLRLAAYSFTLRQRKQQRKMQRQKTKSLTHELMSEDSRGLFGALPRQDRLLVLATLPIFRAPLTRILVLMCRA